MKNRLLQLASTLLMCCLSVVCQQEKPGTVTFEVNVAPPYHTANTELFIAGSFNNWTPDDKKYRLKLKNEGKFISY